MTKCINDFELHLLIEKQMSFGLVIEWVCFVGWLVSAVNGKNGQSRGVTVKSKVIVNHCSLSDEPHSENDCFAVSHCLSFHLFACLPFPVFLDCLPVCACLSVSPSCVSVCLCRAGLFACLSQFLSL